MLIDLLIPHTLSKVRIDKCPLDLETWRSLGILMTVVLEARTEWAEDWAGNEGVRRAGVLNSGQVWPRGGAGHGAGAEEDCWLKRCMISLFI